MLYIKFKKKYKKFLKKRYFYNIYYKNFLFNIYISESKKLNINFFFIKKIKNAIIRNNIKSKIRHLIQEYLNFFKLIKKNIFIIYKSYNNFNYIIGKKYILFFLRKII
ncbi:MAG: hypothetical protein ABNO50_00795 [Candidatus Shikimatogenerans sp. Tduv]|uniref:Uncharacterized protein n=1 Tax=Candidatus Shikimatogenerans sp. Tduv TaxID=3158567 RepID=A0AAU7QQZ9_9FLAO